MRRAVLGVAIVSLAGCEHLPFTDDETTVPATTTLTTRAPTTTTKRRPEPVSPRTRAQLNRVRRDVDCADVRRLARRHARWTPARIREELVADVFPRQDALNPEVRGALRQIVDECWRRVNRGD